MTLDQFATITAQRIPTAPEFVAFAEGQRWRFAVNGDGASLMANRNDPLALAFAKMLSREPYRTNVLLHLANRGAQSADTPGGRDAAATSEPPSGEPEPEGESCRVCSRNVMKEDIPRLADPLYCDRGANPRCPYKPPGR